MEIFVQEILRINVLAQDYHSDDDVLAIIDSDSDILETNEKADFVEVLDDDSSMLAGFWRRVKYIGNLHSKAPEVNFWRETTYRNLGGFSTRPNKRVGLVKSTVFSIVLKSEVPFCSFWPDPIYWSYKELTYTPTSINDSI